MASLALCKRSNNNFNPFHEAITLFSKSGKRNIFMTTDFI